MPGACAGIRVLDCSRGAAGSLATMVLADFGAEVVRVEPPGSDARRHDARVPVAATREAEHHARSDLRPPAGRSCAASCPASTWSSKTGARAGPRNRVSATPTSRPSIRRWSGARSPASETPVPSPASMPTTRSSWRRPGSSGTSRAGSATASAPSTDRVPTARTSPACSPSRASSRRCGRANSPGAGNGSIRTCSWRSRAARTRRSAGCCARARSSRRIRRLRRKRFPTRSTRSRTTGIRAR